MAKIQTKSLLIVALLLVSGVLASCGASNDTGSGVEAAATSTAQDASPDPASDDPASTDSGRRAKETATAAAVADSDSPIDQLLGVPLMDEAAMNDYVADIITEGERRTATCMLAEGFEYTPVVVRSGTVSAQTDSSTREYAERIGFGIVAGFDESTSDGTAPQEPNALYYNSLTDGEKSAYEIALNGKEHDDPSVSEVGGFLDFGGCKALAAEELLNLFGVLDEFEAPANNVFDAWQADARMQESRMMWSRCMAEAGYTIEHPDDVREQVFERMFPLVDNPDAYDVTAGEPEFETDFGVNNDWSELLSGDFFGPHPPLTVAARAELDEVAAFERGLAVAHFDCYEPLREGDLAVQREYEQVLVDEIGDRVTERLGAD